MELRQPADAGERPSGNADPFSRLTVEHMTEAAIFLDPEGVIACANPAACRLTGYPRDELQGMPLCRLDAGVLASGDWGAHWRQIRTGAAERPFESRIRTRTGAVVPVEIRTSLVVLEGKEYGCSFARDITVRKLAEEKFHTIFNATGEAIFLHDPGTGAILEVNEGVRRMYGYAPEEARRLTVADLSSNTPPYTDAGALAWMRRAAGGEPQTFEWRAKDKAGRLFWAEINMRLISIGSERRVLVVVRDITRRKEAEEALRKSEEQVRLLLDSTAEAIYGLDLRGNCTFANPACCRILGYAGMEQLLGKNMHDLIHHSFADGRRMPVETCRIYQAFREGKGVHVDDEVLWRADGTSFPAEYWSYPQVVNGVVSGSVVAFIDITKRRQAEEDLLERNKELNCIYSISDIAEAGRPVEELFQKAVRFIPPGWQHPKEACVRIVFAGREFRTDNFRETPWMMSADLVVRGGLAGRVEVGYLREMPPQDDGPFLKEERALIRLIAQRLSRMLERRQAQDALVAERRRLSHILEGTNAGTWEWNVQTGEIQANGRWAEIIGYTLAELGPLSTEVCMRLAHPDDVGEVRDRFERHARKELPFYECEFRMRHKDGSWVWVLDKGRIVEWTDDGRPLLMSGTRLDITEHKRAEAEKEKLQGQLIQMQKMESIGRLAGGVAHDFNNMLGVIMGHVELCLDGVEPGQALYGDLQEIRKTAERSANLTRQLLAFARKQTAMPKILDLNATVESMLKMLRRLIGEDIDLAWQPKAALWPVRMDPSQIDQILANLCVNARDAIAGAGKVTIETENVALAAAHGGFSEDIPAGDYVRLTVGDNGCGMAKEVQSHLFEPFFTTKKMGEGTGLGLATVYGIVRQNNGFVDVQSEQGWGTAVCIYLPRHTEKSSDLKKDVRARQRPSGGRETILLVEDEPANLWICKRMLESLGYTVLAAGTPAEALRLAGERAGQIHLLLTDVVMPEINGWDLAKRLLAVLPKLKCLFMSGYTADILAQHNVLAEDVNFVQKPFSMAELAAKVREVLEAGGADNRHIP